MTGLHPWHRTMSPIDRDKKVTEEYLILPFKVELQEYSLDLSEKINNKVLEKTKKLYEDFFDLCSENNFDCQIKDTQITK